MKICFKLMLTLVCLIHKAYTAGNFYEKYLDFSVDNGHIPYKSALNVQSYLSCLSYCNRESNCQTVHLNEQTKTCSFYDCKIDVYNLVSQPLSMVFRIKSNLTIN
jgi:hypothetical protein